MEKTFAEKVIAVQSELNAPKSQFNKFGGFYYRSCEDIMEAVKKPLKEQGLFLTVNDEVVVIGDRYYVKATATLSDGKDSIFTSALSREPMDKKGMDQSQITGSSSSYARKYALSGLLCLDDNKDEDGKDNTKSGKKEDESETLKKAIEEINAVKNEDELAVVTRKYKPSLGKNMDFVKAVKASPFCPKQTAKK